MSRTSTWNDLGMVSSDDASILNDSLSEGDEPVTGEPLSEPGAEPEPELQEAFEGLNLGSDSAKLPSWGSTTPSAAQHSFQGSGFRFYTVWAAPAGCDIVGVHSGPYTKAYEEIMKRVPGGFHAKGLHWRRYDSQDGACAAYFKERGKHKAPEDLRYFHW